MAAASPDPLPPPPPPPPPPLTPRRPPPLSTPTVVTLGYENRQVRTNVQLSRDPGALPGRLVTIGIISILWGALTVVVGGWTYFSLRADYANSVPPPAPVAPTPPTPVSVVPYDGDFIHPRGLPFDVRDPLTKAVADRLKLPADRVIMLERFLADAGRDAFGDDVTPADARQASSPSSPLITGAGQAPRGHDGEGPFAPHFVVTPHGRLELNNSRVIFTPSAGGPPTTLDGTLLSGSDARVRWSARAVKAALEQVRKSRLPQPTTSEQAAVIAAYIANAPAAPPRSHRDHYGFYHPDVQTLGMTPTGSPMLLILVNGAPTFVLPDGRQAPTSRYPNGWDANFNPLPRATPPFQPAMPGSLAAICMMGVEALAHMVIGTMLLTAGVLTVAGLRGSARVHRLWAYSKFVVAVGSIALGVWYVRSLPGVITSNRQFQAGVAGTVFGMFASIGYAVAVLFVLHSALARAYYDFRKETNALFSTRTRARWRALATQPAVRVALVSSAAIAALGAAMHARSAMAVTGDGASVPHVGLFALALAVASFCTWHLLAPLLRGVHAPTETHARLTTLVVVVVVVAPVLLAQSGVATAQQSRSARPSRSGETPKSTIRPTPVPEAEQVARADPLLRELAEWNPRSATSGELWKRQQQLRDALVLGPHAERIAFEKLPTAKGMAVDPIVSALRDHLQDHPIAPEAHAAAKAAIPALAQQAQNRYFSEGSAPLSIIRRIAAIPGATPDLCRTLLKLDCPPHLIGVVLASGDRAAAVETLSTIALRGGVRQEQREDALQALAYQGEPGMTLVRQLADGTHPLVRESEAVNDHRRQLRVLALRMLAPRDTKDEPAPANLDAAVASLASREHTIRFTARSTLSQSGRAGLERLIAYYRDKAPPNVLKDAGHGITGTLPYPVSLFDEPRAVTPEHRQAAATILTLLASYYEPGRGLVNVERAVPELQRMIDGDDPELRRQAAATMLSAWPLQKGLDDDAAIKLLESPHADVRAAAAKSLLGFTAQERKLPLELLIPFLKSEDPELRRLAARRVFASTNRELEKRREMVFAALDSPHADVARAAGGYISGSDYYRERIGLDTWSKIDRKLRWDNYARMQFPPADPTMWASAPAAPPAATNASAPTAPAGPVELPLFPAGWLTLCAAALTLGFGLLAVITARGNADRGAAAHGSSTRPRESL